MINGMIKKYEECHFWLQKPEDVIADLQSIKDKIEEMWIRYYTPENFDYNQQDLYKDFKELLGDIPPDFPIKSSLNNLQELLGESND